MGASRKIYTCIFVQFLSNFSCGKTVWMRLKASPALKGLTGSSYDFPSLERGNCCNHHSWRKMAWFYQITKYNVNMQSFVICWNITLSFNKCIQDNIMTTEALGCLTRSDYPYTSLNFSENNLKRQNQYLALWYVDNKSTYVHRLELQKLF